MGRGALTRDAGSWKTQRLKKNKGHGGWFNVLLFSTAAVGGKAGGGKKQKKKKRSFSIHFAIDRYEQGGITQLMVCLPETDNPSRGNQLSFIHTA